MIHLHGEYAMQTMDELSKDNTKISDSGHSNTFSNSQSQPSSGSSVSKNSNQSESSGYCGGHPSTLDSSNEAHPQPINKRKDKEHKKKKVKAALVDNAKTTSNTKTEPLLDSPSHNVYSSVPVPSQKTEVANVELVDATDPAEYNSDTIQDQEAGFASQTNLLDDTSSEAHDGFCMVITMHDGLVLYTTPSICTALGYPVDAWTSHSFLEYVHPKDTATLEEHITARIALLACEDTSKDSSSKRTSLFCGLRKNTGFHPHQTVEAHLTARSNLYLPFHLILHFREYPDQAVKKQPKIGFLVIDAQPVYSAYKVPEDTIISTIFTTRHNVTCHISHVDPEVVQYLGYLPQDMIGRSLFDFYHPEDLPFIKDIYETVVKLEDTSFRSKPYRFAAQNGGYVILDTEWSSFVNPWTKRLEFVVGQHRVLRGPIDPDVFRTPYDHDTASTAHNSEVILKEAKVIQNEICTMLAESFASGPNIIEHDAFKRYNDLASFMENLVQEIKVPMLGKEPLHANVKSFSEHDSMMLGEISPHHEDYDSKSSTETPPSYNQLNYNENLERFFNSKPAVTLMYGGDEYNMNSEDEKSNQVFRDGPANKCMSPINGSGGSGSGSAENLSSGSNDHTSSTSRGNTSNTTSNNTSGSFKPATLTESLLNKHNDDMEKMMMQKHREFRFSIKNSDKLKDSRVKNCAEKAQPGQSVNYFNQPHGVKRCNSHVREGGAIKISKREKSQNNKTVKSVSVKPLNTVIKMNADLPPTLVHNSTNINLRPPLPATMLAPTFNEQSEQNESTLSGLKVPTFPHIVPVYYVPVPSTNMQPSEPPPQNATINPTAQQQSQQNLYALSGFMYPSIFNGVAPGAMMYRPVLMPQHHQVPVMPKTLKDTENKSSAYKHPASQATSVKTELGSITGMSASCKKVLSPEERISSCVSLDDSCSCGVDGANRGHSGRERYYTSDESSSSTFNGSFLNKSSDCSCIFQQHHQHQQLLQQQRAAQEVKNVKENQANRKNQVSCLKTTLLTPEITYEYQINSKTLSESLQNDMEILKTFNQPLMVNEQLGQLYMDLELGGFDAKLILEDGITSSSSESESRFSSCNETTLQQKQARRRMKHSKLVMIHEENAPLPPPV